MIIPPGMTVRTYERSGAGPLGKFVCTVATEPGKQTTPSMLTDVHTINFIGYQQSVGMLGATEAPTVYGRVGDFLVARGALTGPTRNGTKITARFATVLDGNFLHSISTTGLDPDDDLTLKLMESIVGTLK